MANKRIIDISIKAHMIVGSSLDDQFNALSLIKKAHETGDYSAVLAAAKIDLVKAEPKSRRFPDEPAAEAAPSEAAPTEVPNDAAPEAGNAPDPSYDIDEAEVPAFLKKGKGGAGG